MPDSPDGTDSLLAMMDAGRVVVCCGSGGVGKTTVAAALGVEMARRGRRVVVVTIDPARRLADALGLNGGLGPEPAHVPVPGPFDGDATGELWAMMLDPGAAFATLVRQHAADADQADRIVGSAFFRNMAGSLSGTQEYMAAETLFGLYHDERFDLVVVDTPPSRRALDFLAAPGVLTRFLDHKLFRLMMLPAQRGLRVVGLATQPLLRTVGKVVGSDVLADAVAFFQSFAGMETGFRDRAQAVSELLRSGETRFVVIASPRHETVSEAVWFAGELAGQGIDACHVAGVVNRLHPRFGIGTAADAWSEAEAEGVDNPARIALRRNLAELRTIREAELDEVEPFVARFGTNVSEIPLFASDVHDADALGRIGAALLAPSGR